ncbi:MAG: hypothetical protein [Bat faecal associated arto-like virus 2]|nr:MAG: hypothetical protein [Bat faecal associated arto-like virus 2]
MSHKSYDEINRTPSPDLRSSQSVSEDQIRRIQQRLVLQNTDIGRKLNMFIDEILYNMKLTIYTTMDPLNFDRAIESVQSRANDKREEVNELILSNYRAILANPKSLYDVGVAMAASFKLMICSIEEIWIIQ